MTTNYLIIISTFLTLAVFSCTQSDKTSTETVLKDTLNPTPSTPMKTHISIFEIPATEIDRAIKFYKTILNIPIEKMEIPEMQMGIFPYEGQMVSGVIIKAAGYKPSADGVTIYLNGGDNLQTILDKVEKNGGKILTPKTAHADESGFFALFIDSEGNKMGLHSPK